MSRFMPAAIVSASVLFINDCRAEQLIDRGRVALRGAIHQGACAIKVDDAEQTIAMGVLPLARLQRDGKGPGFPFSIQLVNCPVEYSASGGVARTFSITFDHDGPPGQQRFAVYGDAKGIELMITDTQGNTIAPGEAQPIDQHLTQQHDLRYRLTLVSNQQQLHSGSYAAAIRFHINYN